jgi:2-oxoisovalerate dehydrogenase E1 component
MCEPIVDWLKTARLVTLSRALDHLEEEQLAPQGKIKFQFSAQGHELAQVLLAQALDHPHDAATVYYRSRPFLLSSGLSVTESLAAGMARQGSPSQGRDAGVIYNLPRRSGLTILPASGDVGTQYTPAAGWAQAITYRKGVLNEPDWGGALAAALGGDGSIASNGFWSALTIATTLHLPLLFFIEDNRYGISVSSQLQTPGGDIAANLAAFQNLKVLNGDGSSPAEAWDLISAAVSYVRSGEGPCLLACGSALERHTFIDDHLQIGGLNTVEARSDPLERLQPSPWPRVCSARRMGEAMPETHREIEARSEAESLPSP